MTLLQILTTGINLIWYYDIFFYLFILFVFVTTISWIYFIKILKKRSNDMKLLQQQHVAKIDIIRKENTNTLEKIRIEMLKREEERTRQSFESEKEILHVLNGISVILDLNEKIGKNESGKVLKKLQEIEQILIKITEKEK